MSLLSRRSFLTVAVAGAVLPACAAARAGEEAVAPYVPGIQLSGVAAALKADFDGTLAALAAMGYRAVELDVDLEGLKARSAAAWKKALKASGLATRSAHFRVTTLQYDFDRALDFAREIGLEYMVCAGPRASDGVCPSFEEWRWNAAFLNTIGSLTNKAGIRFGYHTQGIEFTRYPVRRGEVRTGLEEILDGTNPAFVTLQLHCGWAAAAGQDPAVLLARHTGRFALLHIGDITPNGRKRASYQIGTTAIGQGTLDWKAILTAARTAGVKGYFVDLHPATDPFALFQQSAAFMQQL
jgi:sugar phosphate isomerase/epimerase